MWGLKVVFTPEKKRDMYSIVRSVIFWGVTFRGNILHPSSWSTETVEAVRFTETFVSTHKTRRSRSEHPLPLRPENVCLIRQEVGIRGSAVG